MRYIEMYITEDGFQEFEKRNGKFWLKYGFWHFASSSNHQAVLCLRINSQDCLKCHLWRGLERQILSIILKHSECHLWTEDQREADIDEMPNLTLETIFFISLSVVREWVKVKVAEPWKLLRDKSWEKWSVSDKVKYNGQCMGRWDMWYQKGLMFQRGRWWR